MNEREPTALLIAPPIYDFALYDLFLKPYGLLRVGRWLSENGYKVRFLNALDYRESTTASRLGYPRRQANGTGKFFRRHIALPAQLTGIGRRYARYGIDPDVLGRQVESLVRDARPQIVLVGSGMTYWYPGVAEVVGLVHRVAPNVPVVVGGVYATLCPRHCRSATGADFVAEGSAEAGLLPVLETLGLPAPRGPVSGPPLWDPVFEDAAVLRLNAGCPMECDYCASRLLSDRFVPGSGEKLAARVDEYFHRLGTRVFAFYDDALLVHREGLRAFLDALLSRHSESRFRFYLPNAVHLVHLDVDTARLMRRAGFQELRFGFESSSESFHQAHDRKTSWDTAAAAVAAAREAGFSGMDLAGYVLAGLPRQPAAEVEQSIRDVSALGVRARIAQYSPVPGTPLWQESVRASRYPIDTEPLYQNSTYLPLEWEGFTRRDLDRLKELARSLQPTS
jgi:radical SAM superfamily enzyme YgiQ (UPF0313 family)